MKFRFRFGFCCGGFGCVGAKLGLLKYFVKDLED